MNILYINILCSSILETLGRILAGQQLSLVYLSPPLKTGVILACFRTDGNSGLVTEGIKTRV